MLQVKVLVVDDSAIYRMIVANAMAKLSDVTLVGRCKDGKEALEAIRQFRPDLVTLDVEMPVMDGLTTLREIRQLTKTEDAFRSVRVVLLSALTKKGTDTTIQGLNEGALDCIPKPEEGDIDRNREVLAEHLQKSVDIVRTQLSQGSRSHPTSLSATTPHPTAVHSTRQHSHSPATPAPTAPIVPVRPEFTRRPITMVQRPEVILIGVSTGGPAALSIMLPELCKRTHLPILIVQHMPAGFTKSLAESLTRKCGRPVVEAVDGQLIESSFIYVAPGGRHMQLKSGGSLRTVELTDAPAENGCRPSVDVLFRSAAQVYGNKCIALILTGMGSDGTLGAKPLKALGVPILVQDKDSSVVWGMPGSAVEAGVADDVQPLMSLPEVVAKLLA